MWLGRQLGQLELVVDLAGLLTGAELGALEGPEDGHEGEGQEEDGDRDQGADERLQLDSLDLGLGEGPKQIVHERRDASGRGEGPNPSVRVDPGHDGDGQARQDDDEDRIHGRLLEGVVQTSSENLMFVRPVQGHRHLSSGTQRELTAS